MKSFTLCLTLSILIVFSGCTTLLLANTDTLEFGTNLTGLGSNADNSPSVIPVQTGLSGTITADILVDKLAPDADETVFLGTSVGLYMISGGSIQDFIYTPAPVIDIALIDDCTGDSMRELVICLSTSCFPGVQCYDSATGDELWHFIPTHEAVVMDVGWTDLQTTSVDLETVADFNADGVMEIIVASGRSLYMVDGKTGQNIWTFEAGSVTVNDEYISNNLTLVTIAGDVNGDGIADLVSAGQGGFLYVISGKNGGLLRQIRLVEEEEYTSDYNNTSESGSSSSDYKTICNTRCLQADGRNKAAVSYSGDDTVILVDLHDGSTGWESSLSYTSSDIEVELSLADDITGDSVPELLATGKTSSSIGITLLNGSTGAVLWDTALATQNDAQETDVSLLDDTKSVLVPLGRSGLTEKVAILNLEDGETRETLEIMSVAATSSLSSVKHLAAGFDNSSFIIASDDGDLMRVSSQGDRLWYLPRISDLAVKKGQFNSDSASELLLYCDRVLLVRDGSGTEELWSYELPYDDLVASGGLDYVKVTSDINSDQYEDILAGQGSNVMVFDGNNGSLLLDHAIDKEIAILDMIDNGDSVAFIAGTSTHIFVITPAGDQLCSLLYSTWITEAEPSTISFLVQDDINQDGISDLVIASESQILLLESSLTGSDLTFAASATDIQPEDIKSISSAEIVVDIDSDGCREIFFRVAKTVDKEDYTYSIIVSPSSGETLLEVDEKGGFSLDPGCADFNDDGYLDSLAYWSSGINAPWDVDVIEITGGEGGVFNYAGSDKPRLAVISGKDQETLWSHSCGYGSSYTDQGSIPATPYFDVEASEAPHLLYVEVIEEKSSLDIERIKVVNVTSGEIIKDIIVGKRGTWNRFSAIGSFLPVNDFTGDSYPSSTGYNGHFFFETSGRSGMSSRPELLKDMDRDGSREIALFEQQTTGRHGSYPVDMHPVIASIADEKVMSYFILPCTELLDLDSSGKTGMLNGDGLLYILDTITDLQITSPAEGASLSSPVEISWQGSDPAYYNLIFVDDVLYDITHQSKIKLALEPGSHKLSVYSLDRYGRVSIQSINVQVKNQPLYLVLVICLIVLAIVAIYSAKIIRAVDRRHLRKSGQ